MTTTRRSILTKTRRVITCGAPTQCTRGKVTAQTHASETYRIPSRAVIMKELKSGEEFDVLVIGGGATGAGAALDAQTRGLRVACVEREDFACKLSFRASTYATLLIPH
jgi:heterodisulfide reductase subunit A-like polyferredoxin